MRFVRKITALSLWYGCLCSAFATHWSCVQNVCCHRELRRELWDADSSSYVHQDFVSPQPEGDFSNAKFRNYHQSGTCLQHFLVSRLLFFTNFIVCCSTAWPKWILASLHGNNDTCHAEYSDSAVSRVDFQKHGQIWLDSCALRSHRYGCVLVQCCVVLFLGCSCNYAFIAQASQAEFRPRIICLAFRILYSCFKPLLKYCPKNTTIPAVSRLNPLLKKSNTSFQNPISLAWCIHQVCCWPLLWFCVLLRAYTSSVVQTRIFQLKNAPFDVTPCMLTTFLQLSGCRFAWPFTVLKLCF